jgi:hypothetical protein
MALYVACGSRSLLRMSWPVALFLSLAVFFVGCGYGSVTLSGCTNGTYLRPHDTPGNPGITVIDDHIQMYWTFEHNCGHGVNVSIARDGDHIRYVVEAPVDASECMCASHVEADTAPLPHGTYQIDLVAPDGEPWNWEDIRVPQ